MINLKKLRFAIVLLWISITFVFLTQNYPEIPSYLSQAKEIILSAQSPASLARKIMALFILVLLVYSSATLWDSQESGKWAFILYVILLLSFNDEAMLFLRWHFLFVELTNIITGVILFMLFISPIKEQLKKKKPFISFTSITAFVIFTSLMAFYLSII